MFLHDSLLGEHEWEDIDKGSDISHLVLRGVKWGMIIKRSKYTFYMTSIKYLFDVAVPKVIRSNVN